MKRHIVLIIFLLNLPVAKSQECITVFNFNNWSMEGTPDANWELSSATNVFNASYDFPATFFVSPQKLINVLVKGTISVESTTDNDFVGIVFGYEKPTLLADDNPYKFFLFDWKSETESFSGYRAEEGFRLSYYNGNIPLSEQGKYFWGTENNPPIRSLLSQKYGSSLGWEHHQKYQFELLYSTNRIRIKIDNNVVFEREGCFPAGKIGFYCLSQDLSRFEEFSYESFIDFVPEPASICQNESIFFNAFNLECSSFPDFVESMHWDFGDGQSSTEINPVHFYNTVGKIPVELIVHKAGNCIDTIVKEINVKPLPLVDLGQDTVVSLCASIVLDAENPGSSYTWSNGESSQKIELQQMARDTTLWVIVEKNECFSGDSIHIGVEGHSIEKQLYFPNAFSPNGDGKNDVFEPLGPTDYISSYQLEIFNRWGQQVYKSDDPQDSWDGRISGNKPVPGVYIYSVHYLSEGPCIESTEYAQNSSITIIL